MQRIVILNFEKYNPRKNRKTHSWVRLNNTIVFDLKRLSPAQKWFWVSLLALASFKQRDWVPYDLESLADDTKVGIEDMKSALDFFVSPTSGDTGKPMAALMTIAEYDQYRSELAAAAKAEVDKSGDQSDASRIPSGDPTDRQTDDTDVTNESSSRYNEASSKSELSAQLLIFLNKTKALSEVLPLFSPETIEFLLNYEQNWLSLNLQKFVSHVKEKQNVRKGSELKNLDSGLLGWLAAERKPQYSNLYANALQFQMPSKTTSSDSQAGA